MSLADKVRGWLAEHDPTLEKYADKSSADVARMIADDGVIPHASVQSAARAYRKMLAGEIPAPVQDDGEDREGVEEVDADAPDTGDTVALDWDNNRYLFSFVEKGSATPWDADFKEISEWAWWYTHQGENRTARDCCNLAYEEHGRTITEAWFRRAMRILGLLKSSPPLAPHELEKYPRAEQQERIIFQRRQARAQRAITSSERRQWRRIAEQAQRDLEDQDRAIELLAGLVNSAPVREIAYTYPEKTSPYLAVAGAFDVHIGKRTDTGGLDATIEDFLTAGEKLARRIAMCGTPEKILVAFGGDYFHVDTKEGTTTAGTRQDVDASTARIINSGTHAAIEYIEIMREVAPVEVIVIAGNHDATLTAGLATALEIRYAHINAVEFTFCADTMQYARFGDCLLAFEHGDGPKQKDLANLMSHDARQRGWLWKKGFAFVGHLHHEHAYDIGGVTVLQCPSLAHADAWHAKKGFRMSTPSHAAYLFDREEGLIGALRATL